MALILSFLMSVAFAQTSRLDCADVIEGKQRSLSTPAHLANSSHPPHRDLALSAALEGAELANFFLQKGALSKDTKGDGSIVTEADLKISALLMKRLGEGSGLPVLSEEMEPPSFEELRLWKRFWIIDPIDGTKQYSERNPDFSIMIALMERLDPSGPAQPILGIVVRPPENIIYLGAQGAGSWKIDFSGATPEYTRIYASSLAADRRIRVTTHKKPQDIIRQRHVSLADQMDLVRVGGNGAKFIALAKGEVDSYLGQWMKWWDIAAGDALYRFAVADGEAARPSPLKYIPHPNLFTYQERGFVLGAYHDKEDLKQLILQILNP